MDPVLSALLAVQLGISVGTIIVVWSLSARVRAAPDVAAMEQHVNALRTEVSDLVDKYESVARRASTSRAREAKEQQRIEEQPATVSDKTTLRKMVGQITLQRRGVR